MTKNIFSLVLWIVSVLLSFKHGWDSFHYKSNPASVEMMNDLGIKTPAIPVLGLLTTAVGVLLLIPKTFFVGNMLNALSICLIMCLALRAGNLKIALIEIPFFALPLVLIWLKYPFKN